MTANTRRLLALTSLGLAGLLAGLLAGCSAFPSTTAATTTSTQSYTELSGNWQFTSTGNASLSSLGGSLTVSGSNVTGMLHPLAGACLTPANAAPFAVAGTISSAGLLTLTSTGFAGGEFTLTGTIAANQHSLQNPAYTVSGGSCSAATPTLVRLTPQDGTSTIAQQYQPISGTYTGNFSDPDGFVMAVSANLQQSASPDSNGYYHLSGTATFANNPCLNTPVVTDSVINGSSITATYTDSATGNSITGSGTFDSTATTLNVTNWVLTGTNSCADAGTGSIAK